MAQRNRKLWLATVHAACTVSAVIFSNPIYAEVSAQSPLKFTTISRNVIPSTPSYYSAHCATIKAPDVNGLSIQMARKVLMKHGWNPIRNSELYLSERELTFFDLGVTEITACSGSGMASCFFQYEKTGYQIRVITVGEYDEVVGNIQAYCPDLE